MSNSPSSGPALGPTIVELTDSYRTAALRPSDVVDQVLHRITERGDDGTWITVLDRAELMIRAKELEQQADPRSLPLFGIPFGVKDSIDVEGVPVDRGRRDFRGQDQSRPVRHRSERHPHALPGAAERVRWKPDFRGFEFRVGCGGRDG